MRPSPRGVGVFLFFLDDLHLDGVVGFLSVFGRARGRQGVVLGHRRWYAIEEDAVSVLPTRALIRNSEGRHREDRSSAGDVYIDGQ